MGEIRILFLEAPGTSKGLIWAFALIIIAMTIVGFYLVCEQ